MPKIPAIKRGMPAHPITIAAKYHVIVSSGMSRKPRPIINKLPPRRVRKGELRTRRTIIARKKDANRVPIIGRSEMKTPDRRMMDRKAWMKNNHVMLGIKNRTIKSFVERSRFSNGR